MKKPTPDQDLLAPLRSLPLPMELGQVERLVAAFPAATGLAAWLARIRTNFNSILTMTISGTAILLATYLFTGSPTPAPHASTVIPATIDTTPAVHEPISEVVITAADEVEAAIPSVIMPEPQASTSVETSRGEEENALHTTVAVQASTPVSPIAHVPQPPAGNPVGMLPAMPAGAFRTFPITGFAKLAIGSAPSVNPAGVRKRGKVKTVTSRHGSPMLLVEVAEGPYAVTATGDGSLLDLVRADVVKGKAFLYWAVDADFPKDLLRDTVRVQVALPRLESVAVLGPQQVVINELHDSEELELSLVGSGSIRLVRALALEKLQVLQSGSGTIDCQKLGVRGGLGLSQVGSGRILVSGKAGSLSITQSGSGAVVGHGLSIGQEANLSQVGSGLVALTGSAGSLTTTQSGSGRITCDGTSPWGNVELSHLGSGQTTLSGEATDLTITFSGSGGVDASGLAVPTANVSLLGSGSVRVEKAGTVNTTVVGSGTIHTRNGVQKQTR